MRKEITNFIKHPKYPGSNILKLTDSVDHWCFIFFLAAYLTASSLGASSDDRQRAQRNVILMKAQAWLEQDAYDGPGRAWSAGDVKQVPWLPTKHIQEFQKILFFKSHTKGKYGNGGRGWVQL